VAHALALSRAGRHAEAEDLRREVSQAESTHGFVCARALVNVRADVRARALVNVRADVRAMFVRAVNDDACAMGTAV
jgi:hypothetical protein